MNYRPFWKRSFIPAAVIITSLLASTLLIPVGSAYWTETLWGNVSVSPLEMLTLTPDATPTFGPTATSTPKPTQVAPTAKAPTATPAATEPPPKDGGMGLWTPTAIVEQPVETAEPVETEPVKPPADSPTAAPQEPVETEAPGETEAPEKPGDGGGVAETPPPAVPQPAETEAPGTGEEDEATPPAPDETDPVETEEPEEPGEGEQDETPAPGPGDAEGE